MSESLPAAIAVLRAAFPSQPFPEDSVRVYVRALADVPSAVLTDAVDAIVKTSRFRPTIAEIRETVARRALDLPTAGVAWVMANDPEAYSGDWPPVLIDTVRACGGRFAIRTSENPTTMRAQFTRDYEQRVNDRVREVALNEGAIPAGHFLPKTPDRLQIPVTTRMPLRPVLRWYEGEREELPDDYARRDAILILKEPYNDFLHTAALAVLDRCSRD